MADKYDDLLAIRDKSAQEAALRQIYNQAQAERADYDRYLQEGDTEKAAWAHRGYQALATEYNTRLAAMGAAQQQAQPQQAPPQPQQQYTEAEQSLMRDYPDQIRKNWNTAQVAANNLIMSKAKADPEADLLAYRNSAEYINGIAHACGITDASGAESIEVQSPNEALAACQSKYGKIDAETYNQGVQKLIEMKKLGYYRPE
jgi:hypothetical protein